MSRQTYHMTIKWHHRKWGPKTEKVSAEGTSIRRAISNALLAFFSDKNSREKRRGANAEISVTAWRIGKKADR